MVPGLDRTRAYAGDVGPAVAVTLVMLWVYRLPERTRLGLAFDYADPTLLTAYASHLVHLTPGHLLSNLGAFGLLLSLTLALAVSAGRRGLFRVAVATYLLAFPLVLSALNLAMARPRVGFGFSGVAMAFLGLLPLMLGAAIEERFPGTQGLRRAPGLFLAGLAAIAWLAVPARLPRLAIVLVAAGAALAYLPRLPTAADLDGGLRWLAAGSGGGVVLAGVVAFFLVPLAAFPGDPANGTTVTNLYTHLLGYSLGFIAPYATVQVLAWWDGRARAAGGRSRRRRDVSGDPR